jgi:nitrogenase molybdenum-iron protein beta chain
MKHSYTERPRYFCAFGGALSTLEALPETIPIMHASIGCAASITWGQIGASALQVGGYCGGLSVPSSNVGEKEVIFGGMNRLKQQIRNTLQIMDGCLYVVITSCVTEVIGDDVQSAVSDIRSELHALHGSEDADLIFAETAGFRGNSYTGYDIVMSAIVKQFVVKAETKKRGKVNILGIVPFMDCFWKGNLAGIRKTLELLGLEVNTFFTTKDTLESIRNSSEAELNIVVSDIYGIEIAKTYQTVHGIPYIVSSLPIGPTATENLLKETVKALNLDVDIDTIVTEQYREYYQLLNPLTDAFYDGDHQRYAIIVADTNYAVAVSRFLCDDLGWIPAYVQFTELLTDSQQELLSKKLANENTLIKPHIVFDTNASDAGKYINTIYPRRDTDLYVETLSPAFVFGSALERDLALRLNTPHLSISFPITNRAIIQRGYTGFTGGLSLIEDILSAVIINR